MLKSLNLEFVGPFLVIVRYYVHDGEFFTKIYHYRFALGVATLDGKLYACGGYDGRANLQTVEMFDPVTNK